MMLRRDDDIAGAGGAGGAGDTDAQHRGTDAWSREARRVRDLAARLGLSLNEAELMLCDVRDLQALRASLPAA